VNSDAFDWRGVLLRLLAALALALAAAPLWAQTTCRFVSTPGAAFGAYDDSSAAPTDTAVSVVVSCTRVGGPATADVVLSLGPSANSGQIANRAMRQGANTLSYNLFRDASRSAVWGQTAGADTMTMRFTSIPNNGSQNGTFVIYGRIPALQNVGAGLYGDSLPLTLLP